MTVEHETRIAQPSRVIAGGRKFLMMLAALIAVTAVCAWIALGVGLYLDVERQTRIVLAVVAALATEALFWTVAALLGVSVVQARKKIWRTITGRRG